MSAVRKDGKINTNNTIYYEISTEGLPTEKIGIKLRKTINSRI
jgi:hypothetical protein